MTKNTFPLARSHAVGTFGLLLMLVVARLVPLASSPPSTSARRLRAMLAQWTIDGIAAIGWLADRLSSGADGQTRSDGGSSKLSSRASAPAART